MNRILAVSTIFWFATGSVLAQDAAWVPDGQAIKNLDSAVQLPDWGRSRDFPNGHIPAVTEFARYYAGSISNGHHMILAEFDDVNATHTTGIHIVASPRDFPHIADGGCHIVHVRYDADAKRVESIICNGYA